MQQDNDLFQEFQESRKWTQEDNDVSPLQKSVPGLIRNYSTLDNLSQRILQVMALSLHLDSRNYYNYQFDVIDPNTYIHKVLVTHLTRENNNIVVTEKEFRRLLGVLQNLEIVTKYKYLSRIEDVYFLSKEAAKEDNITINLAILNIPNASYPELKFSEYRYSYQKTDWFDSYNLIDVKLRSSLNFFIHTNDDSFLHKITDNNSQMIFLSTYNYLFANVVIDDEWFMSRTTIFQQILCVAKLIEAVNIYAKRCRQKEYFLEKFLALPPLATKEIKSLNVLNMYINQLQVKYAVSVAIDDNDAKNEWATALIAAKNSLVMDNSKEALKKFELSIKVYADFFERDHWYWQSDALVLLLITLIREHKLPKIDSFVLNKLKKYDKLQLLFVTISGISALLKNDITAANSWYSYSKHQVKNVEDESNSFYLMGKTIYFWLTYIFKQSELEYGELNKHYVRCQKNHERLAASICVELLRQKEPNLQIPQECMAYSNLHISDLVKVKQDWEYTIDALATILGSNEDVVKNSTSENNRRLQWLIDMKTPNVELMEQQSKKDGVWLRGKKVSVQRIISRTDFDFVSSEDTRALLALEPDPYYRGRHYWNFSKLILELIGHSNVFDYASPDKQLEITKDIPELIVKSIKGGYQLQLPYKIAENQKVIITKITPTKYQVIDINQQLQSLSRIVSKGLIIPLAAKDQLISLISKNNPELRINTDIIDENLATVDANCVPHLQLTPKKEGVIASVFMCPFGANNGYHFPEHGIKSLVSQDENGNPVKIVRNFKLEKQQYKNLLEACPIFTVGKVGDFEWDYEDLEEALQLLAEIDIYKKDSDLVLEWPKGQSLKLKGNVSAKNLKIKIISQQQWFEYDGEVAIDENQVLSLKILMGLLTPESNSRFLRLEDGQFIALTENFKAQLAELKIATEGNKVFHLGSGALDSLASIAEDAKVDKKWKQHLSEIKNREMFTPEIPWALQTELRDYQIEGFNYLSRFTHWKIGTCLADDMGLGKTVQTIALILEQAINGPILVVAPTSVCFNWLEELNKFAPTIKSYLLHNENKRTELIQNLQAGELLICSYNLMQYENDVIKEKEWNLLILDEAQNIKNHTTKRFKAACQINAKCRIALSGTPIENHLGELWSLFRFLNPGLLGSFDSFQNKFINPIVNKNNLVKQTLKKLIQPYILRRTKSQVLSELPPKTEQSIYIEQSDEEQAFYEAIRQESLQKIASLKSDSNNRFSILAEITKLRQACCHSSLINPKVNLENSKLNAFLELVEDLIANHHKVLVFSQYVGYLHIVRDLLDKHKISYQYIDGSTPLKQRKEYVTEFQSGSGDVFLISLKAGGAGLNLTAADYVIILDPWWNPAVEDQAADRAHRIGQERPVTVYRLIVKNSIEEKIIQLHKDKRDLAGDLLSGQDVSAKLNEEDLLNLMKI